ncbi:hypothetical protein SAMN05421505_1203 [Sinosporangium album]|uniref:Uncharacterized protein n=1 Tax=Sinosporangium album TaxID=504805 RepID=A0A1G8E9U9_9ACTN|nr:hypothetical protein [Sinosporangium album]SDH66654.1 hypothetical protein SAMN05421505_1203 [Sinosporangium album]
MHDLDSQPNINVWDKPRPAGPPVSASLRQTNGQPISLNDFETFLRARMETAGGERLALLNAGEAETVGGLLDELAALYPGEAIGRLAREMAVRIYDRMGL